MKNLFPQRGRIRSASLCCLTAIVAFSIVVNVATADDDSGVPAHDEYIYMIRFSPDGKAMATAAGDNTAIIWSWPKLQQQHVLKQDSAVYAAVFSPDSQQVATANGDGVVTLWNAAAGQLQQQNKQHADAIYCVDYSRDGSQLASIGGHGRKGDTTCRIWAVDNLTVAGSFCQHERPAYGVRFASNGTDVITSGGDKQIFVHRLSGGEPKTLTGHTSDVYRFDISPDGKFLASTSQDCSVRIWNLHTGKVIALLEDSKDPTYDVAYSLDGKQLAVAGDDGNVRVWRTADYQLTDTKKLASEGLYAVAWTPDQQRIVAAGVDGKLYFTKP